MPDVLLIHPPSVYDFRERIWFTGPIARTVPALTPVFICVPIGLVSMGEYLNRHGYSVRISNVAERMLIEKQFDAERYIKGVDADIFGIDLHWCVHSQGAIEVANLCKKYHPNSLVVLGGLTATVFHREILERFPFVDMVVRGEAKEPTLSLLQAFDQQQRDFSKVPSITYRENERILTNSTAKPCDDLDGFEFTSLDLVEPKERMLLSGKTLCWHVPVCRGCLKNCATCGGSQYSYQKPTQNRRRPSPTPRTEDRIRILIPRHENGRQTIH